MHDQSHLRHLDSKFLQNLKFELKLHYSIYPCSSSLVQRHQDRHLLQRATLPIFLQRQNEYQNLHEIILKIHIRLVQNQFKSKVIMYCTLSYLRLRCKMCPHQLHERLSLTLALTQY